MDLFCTQYLIKLLKLILDKEVVNIGYLMSIAMVMKLASLTVHVVHFETIVVMVMIMMLLSYVIVSTLYVDIFTDNIFLCSW